MNPRIKKSLNRVAPNIAFALEYTEDPNFVWDGDGPDPSEEGFVAYNIKACAMTVGKGEFMEGCNYLGGCYEKPGHFDPDIGGYLPQVLEAAVSELATVKGLPENLRKQTEAASKWLKNEMRRLYDLHQRQRR